MKYKYYFVLILIIASSKAYSQDISVNNSFIIVINNKVSTSISNMRLVLTDAKGKEDIIHGGYLPGELYVTTPEAKKVLDTDTLKTITLVFENYEYRHNKQFINNYKIPISRSWFKQSFIMLTIIDVNQPGKYKYSFEVPGYSFPLPGYSFGGVKD